MLLLMDSFDHSASADLAEKWTGTGINSSSTITIVAAAARFGAGGLRATYNASAAFGAWVYKTFTPADATCIAGFAFRTDVYPPRSSDRGCGIFAIYDGASPQITVSIRADFRMQVRRGGVAGTVLAVSNGAPLSQSMWAFIEVRCVVHSTLGEIEVRVNNVPVITATGLNTQATASPVWQTAYLGLLADTGSGDQGTSNECDFDDAYILDGSGPAPFNTFLGDCRSSICLPTAEGTVADWTPSTGTNNALNVDDAVPNDDTDYNSTLTIGQADALVVADAPAGHDVLAVQHCLNMKKVEFGACSVAPMIYVAGTPYAGVALSLAASYRFGLQLAVVNPATGVAWTEAGFNAAEFGYKRAS